MTAADFRRIALSLEGVEEHSHAGLPAFRVGGRKSASLALVASHTLHDFPRVGDTSPTVHVFDNYDVIEATKVDTGFLGHSYVFESGSILADVFELFKGTNADKRLRLVPMIVEGKSYWSFQK